MKWLSHILLLLTITTLGIISCSEEEMQADGIEPFVTVKFINQDSVNIVNGLISDIDLIIDDIDAQITGIDTAENRAQLRDKKDSLNLEKDTLETERSIKVTNRNDIRNGLILLSSLSSSSGMEEIPSTIERREHIFPINSNSTSAIFYTTLYQGDGKRLDTVEFTYDLETKFIENQLRAIASNLDVPYFSFDSVVLKCKDSLCISNEAELTVYF